MLLLRKNMVTGFKNLSGVLLEFETFLAADSLT
jgi:hypothetical protein